MRESTTTDGQCLIHVPTGRRDVYAKEGHKYNHEDADVDVAEDVSDCVSNL